MPRAQRITLALLTVAGAAFALLQTLVVPALPAFQHEFGVEPSATAWIVTGFLLSSSVLTPILGRLGDAHGKKKLLVISLGFLGVGAVGAGLAWDLPSVVAFRVLQGAGAAVFPLSFGLVREIFPREQMGTAVGVLSSVLGIGGGFGLVLSGVIVEHLSWRFLFFTGAVPVLAAMVLAARWIPESPTRTPAKPDWAGCLTLAGALVALLAALSEGASWGWGSPALLGLLAAGAALLALWTRIERRVPEPLVDLAMLTRREMAATNGATMLVGFAMTSLFLLAPTLAEAPAGAGFGASPVQAGLMMLPLSVAMSLAGPSGGRLAARRGGAVPLAAGLSVSGAALAAMAVAHGNPWVMGIWLGALGAGVAWSLAAIGTLVLEHARPEETGVAGGMNLIMRTIGAACGAQVAAGVLTASAPGHGFTLAFGLSAAAALAGLAPVAALRAPRARLRLAPQPA
jgi:MFS family permease